MKTEVTITVDIPENWEFDRMGSPRDGETFWNTVEWEVESIATGRRQPFCVLIIRPVHDWGVTFFPGWVTVSTNNWAEWRRPSNEPSCSKAGIWSGPKDDDQHVVRFALCVEIHFPSLDKGRKAKWRVGE